MKIKVGIFFGGKSVEHEVSVISAIQAINNLDKNKYEVVPIYVSKNGEFYTGEQLLEISSYKKLDDLLNKVASVTFVKDNSRNKVILYKYPFSLLKKEIDYFDIAFPIMHGSTGENGSIQGMFEFLDIPYVGCDVLSSAIGMDKIITKHVLTSVGIQVLECYSFYNSEWINDESKIILDIEKQIGYPCIIKPATGGSSIGISKALSKKELIDGIDLARTMAEKIVVERLVENIKEINCSVLGDSESLSVSVCEEPISSKDILTFEDKYLNDSTKGMSSLKRKIPADITENMTAAIHDISKKAFRVLGCSGVVRIDYIIDMNTNKIYLNELNTIPGSLAFYLWDKIGVSYTKLLDDLIVQGIKRYSKKSQITYSYNNNLFQSGSIKGFKK